jgi:hypothetical protein
MQLSDSLPELVKKPFHNLSIEFSFLPTRLPFGFGVETSSGAEINDPRVKQIAKGGRHSEKELALRVLSAAGLL